MDELAAGGGAGMRMMTHTCKVCGKGFSGGRSLGGHMRSHISHGEAVPAVEAGGSNGGGGGGGAYGLRENPKKTRRLSDFAAEEGEDGDGGGGGQYRACRECGKLFSSWRSLFRHLRRDHDGDGEEEEDDVDDQLGEEEFFAEEEAEVEPPVLSPAEDVALCLLMLSRDTAAPAPPQKEEPTPPPPLENYHKKKTPPKPKPKQVSYLPRNAYNSDDDSPAPLQYGDGKIIKSTTKKRRSSGGGHYYAAPNSSSSPKQQQPPPPKRTRYECPGCGRVFSSYQALGGHRASHKRINTNCSAPKPTAPAAAAPEPSVETAYTASSFSTPSPSASVATIGAASGARKKTALAVEEKLACELYYGGGAGAEQDEHVAELDLNFPPAPSSEDAP
ncbi:zinc finger protein ZAT1-like [Brachypodium distachyon]|uniref:zinc finger protein ZAT1-like n=1 Tax=Brachypodium distachyon TaxID=15368 RepID=UPI000D0CA40A|nr:zinc finger protein ZAT1-like [Brachypodium distachyon]|eukprot:XP_014752079.2 zinc finger protein ZAT1-like [Brachypodium distachyon]